MSKTLEGGMMKIILENDDGMRQEIKQFILIKFSGYMFPPTSEMGVIDSECISNIPNPYRSQILGDHSRWEAKTEEVTNDD